MGYIRIAPDRPARRVTVRNDCDCGADHAALIADRIEVDPDTGCWLWTRALNREGYGFFKHRRANWLAHRMSHVAHAGPIPPGLTIDHLCRVRRCVNPDHLEAVTDRQNIMRGVGVSARNASKTHCARGHALPVHVGGMHRACRTCTLADSRAKRAIGGLPPGDHRHGTNGYTNFGCRCDICRQANTDAHRDYMRRRRAAERAARGDS